MAGHSAEMAMVLLGVTSVVLLLAYGLFAAGGAAETDPVFWLLTLAFLVYIGWDVRRHLRTMRSRTATLTGRRP